MKALLMIGSTALLAGALFAQTPPAVTPPPATAVAGPEAKAPDEPLPESTMNGSIDFGVQGVSNSTGSGKFIEYRDVPREPVLPQFRLLGTAAGMRYQLVGQNTARTDQRYLFSADTKWVWITGEYNQIPHRFGVGHSLEQLTSRGSYEISDTLQNAFQTAITQQFAANKSLIAFPFLLNLVSPSLATANPINLALLRKRGFVDFNIFPAGAIDTHVTYSLESRSGNRAAGTSFGFGNVVETAEPINYRTTDVGVSGEMPFTSGLLRATLHVNRFQKALNSFTFDNPFRVTSSTDPSAYTSPGSGSINGAAFGRIGLPPDNKALNGSFGVIYKLPYRSRVTADVNLGRWAQDESFIPYTTNTAIVAPINASDISTLPTTSLNGKVNTAAATVQFTSSPIDKLDLSARWRYYDFDNRTPRITLPGYVRFDAVWEPIGRISVPFGYRTSRGDLMGSYRIGPAQIEAGFRSETWHYTYREVERTTENVWHLGGDVHPLSWLLVRASYEFGDRTFNAYDPEHSEAASFTTAPAPTQPDTMRRFDVNARHVSRVVSTLQMSPGSGNLTVALNYLYNLDRYKNAQFGLQRWKNNSFNAEGDYAPSDRWNASVFYTNEFLGGIQIDEQNGATVSLDPKNDWIANNTDRVNSLGAGVNFTIIPEKTDLHVTGRYQRANGNAALSALVANSNLHPLSISNFDDTRTWTTSAEIVYHVQTTIDLAVGGWIEKYDINDAESSALPNYVPGSFFLAPNDLGYRGNVAYVRASYHW